MKGVLLVNLGTPAAPTPEAVKRYLAEFLSDPRVVTLPRLLWLPILHGVVLRKRPAQSAEKYAAVWTPQGSPLAIYTRRQAEALRAALPDARVEYAMRYGEPSIASALSRLEGCDITAVPLYPQYSESTTESVADKLPPGVRMVREFHDHPGYIAACAAQVRRHWERHGRGPILVLSFHGLPKRGGAAYEAQCIETGSLLARALGLDRHEYRVAAAVYGADARGARRRGQKARRRVLPGIRRRLPGDARGDRHHRAARFSRRRRHGFLPAVLPQ
jgi:ferrochelatase